MILATEKKYSTTKFLVG